MATTKQKPANKFIFQQQQEQQGQQQVEKQQAVPQDGQNMRQNKQQIIDKGVYNIEAESPHSATKLNKKSNQKQEDNLLEKSDNKIIKVIAFQEEQQSAQCQIQVQQNRPIQIITNIIKVKSLPRIKNRDKIVISQEKQEEQVKPKQNNQKLQNQSRQKRKRNYESKQNLFNKQQQDQKQKDSQTSSNKETKPTKTQQQRQFEENLQIEEIYLENRQQSPYYSHVQRKKPAENKMRMEQKIILPPRNAKRQLGKSDDEKQQEEQEEDVSYESDQQQQQEYSNEQYERDMQLYRHQLKMLRASQSRPQVPKGPSMNVKLSSVEILNKFIHAPVAENYQFEAIITVQPGFLGMSPGTKYHLTQKYQPEKLLLSSKKEILTLTKNCYIISRNKANHSRRHEDFLAVMEGSFGGTQWVLTCPRVYKKYKQQAPQCQTQKLVLQYQKSVMGSHSMRDMDVYIVDPSIKNKQIDIKSRIKTSKKTNLIHLKSAKPTYSHGKYKLDFKGLAKMPSNKNFILCSVAQKKLKTEGAFTQQQNSQEQCLIFAKQTENTYQLNVRFPLSLIQGFSIALASLDGKMFAN